MGNCNSGSRVLDEKTDKGGRKYTEQDASLHLEYQQGTGDNNTNHSKQCGAFGNLAE